MKSQFRLVSVQAPASEALYAAHLHDHPVPNLHLVAQFLCSVTGLAIEMIAATNILPSSCASPISRPAMVRVVADHIRAAFSSRKLQQVPFSGGGGQSEIENRSSLGFQDQRRWQYLQDIYRSSRDVFRGILPLTMWQVFSPIFLAQAMTVATSAEERAVIHDFESGVNGYGSKSEILRLDQDRNGSISTGRIRQWYLIISPHSHVEVGRLFELCREEHSNISCSIKEYNILPCNSYSKKEFLGFSDDVGKWRDGILTSVLNTGNLNGREDELTREYVFVEYPTDEELAETLSIAQDKGCLETEGNIYFHLPSNICIVFVAHSINGLAESLLNRVTVLHMHPSPELPTQFPRYLLDQEEFSFAMKQLLQLWMTKSPFSQVNNVLLTCHDWDRSCHTLCNDTQLQFVHPLVSS